MTRLLTKRVATQNPAGGVNPNASPNVGQYGWTKSDSAHVNQLIAYVNAAKEYAEQAKQNADFITGKLDVINKLYNDVSVMYDKVVPLATRIEFIYRNILNIQDDIDTKYEEILLWHKDISAWVVEVRNLHRESGEFSASASKSATDAAASAKQASDIAEELRKGMVYRGTWNVEATSAYPAHGGTNSTWDVILNPGSLEFKWGGTTWYWGDRLIYLKDTSAYQQIESGTTVVSVNGKKGAVTLTATDVSALPISGGDLTGALSVNGRISNSNFNISNKQLIHASNDTVYMGNPEVAVVKIETKDGRAYVRTGATDRRIYHEGFKPSSGDVGAVPTSRKVNGKALSSDITLNSSDVSALPSHGFGMGNKQGGAILARDFTEDKTRDFNKLLTAGEYTVDGNWLNGATNVPQEVGHTGIVKVEVRTFAAGPSYVQTFKSISNGLVNENVRSGTGAYPDITWTTWNKAGRYEQELGHRLTINRTNSTGAAYITLKKREERTDLTSGWYNFATVDMKQGDGTYEPNNPNSGNIGVTIVGARQWDNKRNRCVIQLRGALDGTTKSEVVLYEDGVNLVTNGKAVNFNGLDLSVDKKKVYHEGFKPSAYDVAALPITGGSLTGNTFVDRGDSTEPQLGVTRSGRKLFMADNNDVQGVYSAGITGVNPSWLISRKISTGEVIIGDSRSTTKLANNAFVDRGENNQPFLGVRRGTRETRLYDSGNNAGLYVAGGGTKDTVLISTSVANDTISIGSNDKTLNILGKDTTFTYKGSKVYHEGFKPSAADVGALPASGNTVSSIIDNTTNIGKSVGIYEEITSWAHPIGSSKMVKPASTGNPNNLGGYWQIIGRRDSYSGYAGIWVDYSNTSNYVYIGKNETGTNTPIWAMVYTDKNKPTTRDIEYTNPRTKNVETLMDVIAELTSRIEALEKQIKENT